MSDWTLSTTAQPRRGTRTVTFTARLTVLYLCGTLLPMAGYTAGAGDPVPIALHCLALGVALAALRAPNGARMRSLVAWLPLALGPFLYVELRWLISGAGRVHRDATARLWETSIFSSDPSRTLAVLHPGIVLSESLHASYAAYYALVYLPPLVLSLRGRRASLATTMLALSITYAVCFIIFVMYPVDGPRFLVGPAHAPDGPIRHAVLMLLETASSRGTAFPSSHVAAAVTAAICALRFQPLFGLVVTFVTVLLTIATVYGGFHYGVDALAGVVVGTACSAVAFALAARLESPRQVATAP